MPVIIKRPASTISNGNWAKTPSGGTIHGILSDDSDLTFISTTSRSQLPSQFAVFDIADVTLPTNAKIFSVRVRLRVFQTTASGGLSGSDGLNFVGQIVEEVFEDIGLGFISRLFALIFGFGCPRPPHGGSATWETVELAYYPTKPSGGEWTVDALNAMEWRIGRSDTNGSTAKISEYYVDIDYNEQPTVDVTGPVGPITTTTRPVVTWDYDDPEGDPQAAYRVKVFNSAQYSAPAFDVDTSVPFTEVDWVASQDVQWPCNRDLPDDDYRVFVQVKQVWTGLGDHTSEWDSFDWTQAVPGPPKPSITATPNNPANWVQLDLQPGSGSPATETYNVEYSDNAGVTWQLVRGGFQLPVDASGLATLFDYEAPLNMARWYRAQAYRTLSSIKVASDLSDNAVATVNSYKYWLKDPLDPALNTEIVLSAFNQGGGGASSVQIPGGSGDQPIRPRASGVYAPLVAEGYTTYKIVVNGPRYGIEGVLTPMFLTEDQWLAFDKILDSGRTLLFQLPTGENRYIGFGGDLTWSYLPQGKHVRLRIATISYTQVVKPPDPAAPVSSS